MSRQISVMVVDDHAMLRGMLQRRLELEDDIIVVGSVASGEDAIQVGAEQLPDVVLMDIDMPGMSCFDAARRLRERSPESRVVFLSAFFHDRYIEQAIACEAWAFITKSESEETVIAGIRQVYDGVSFFSAQAQARIVVDDTGPRMADEGRCRASDLTERELEVLRYIARALSKKEIALAMQISVNTVNRHTTSLMNKLDMHDRVELARYAIREGLAEA